jgi:hypothetical protein
LKRQGFILIPREVKFLEFGEALLELLDCVPILATLRQMDSTDGVMNTAPPAMGFQVCVFAADTIGISSRDTEIWRTAGVAFGHLMTNETAKK